MSQSLSDLRRDIDRIDDHLHDLIMQRAEIVERIKALKPGGPAIRPARQAQILRRLLARHKGPLPAHMIAVVWREILGGFTALQGDFTVAATPAMAALARAEYGDAVRVVPPETNATMTVAPWPSDQALWWCDVPDGMTVIAALPFIAADTKQPQAVALAPVPFEASGDDCSLVLSSKPEIPFAGATKIAQNGDYKLFEVRGHIAPNDAGLDNDHILLGGYPNPLRVTK